MEYLRRHKLHNEIIINDAYVFYQNHAVGKELLLMKSRLKVGMDKWENQNIENR